MIRGAFITPNKMLERTQHLNMNKNHAIFKIKFENQNFTYFGIKSIFFPEKKKKEEKMKKNEKNEEKWRKMKKTGWEEERGEQFLNFFFSKFWQKNEKK